MSDSPQATATLAPVVKTLCRGLGPDLVAVALFGSRARGDAAPESDWDLLVIAEHLPEKLLARHFWLKNLLPETWRARVSILAKTPAEFEARLPALYLDIALDAVVLYDPTGYLQQRLESVREQIRRLNLRRERSDGDLVWYWQAIPPQDWGIDWREGQ